jgi:two-component system phosphate regulon response regulator OmpR
VKTRILIVDDDLRLRALLQTYLEQQGFQVVGAGSGEQMRRTLARETVDLLVLDLMLPDEDGLAICARLRAEGNAIPILMLTAKGDDLDRILGLEIGADDYLPKPCNPRELVARIKAILRRQPTTTPVGAPVQDGGVVPFGPYRLDLGRRALSRGDTPLPLTSGEFALLSLFVQHPGETLSRERLLTLTRGRDAGPYDRSVDVQVSRLRRIIEEDPSNPSYIQTVWGVGYVFVPPELGV